MHRPSHSLLLALLLSATSSAIEPNRVSLARDGQPALLEQTQAGSSQTGSAPIDPRLPKLPGDSEFGEQVVLARRASWEPWNVLMDANWFYTDNVALASRNPLQDWYLRSGLSARYSNRIEGDWFVDALVDDHLYLHSKYPEIDFNMLSAEVGVTRRLPMLGDAFLTIHYLWYGISDSSLTTEAFENHAVSVSLQKIWKVTRGQQFTAGLSAEYSIAADPAPPRRHEYSGYVGYRLQLTERFSVNSSYRAGWYDYPETGRNDWNHIVLIGASYDLTEWARLGLSASAAWNRSNSSFFNYDNIVSGVGVTLHLEF